MFRWYLYYIYNIRTETKLDAHVKNFSKEFRKSAKLASHYFHPRSRTRPNSAIETPIFSLYVPCTYCRTSFFIAQL